MSLVLTSWGFFILANLTIFLSPIFAEISDQPTILKGNQLLDFAKYFRWINLIRWPKIFVITVKWFEPTTSFIGGSKGDARDAPTYPPSPTHPPPRGSKFIQFHAVVGKNWPNNSFSHPSLDWRPKLWEVLDPLLSCVRDPDAATAPVRHR